MPSIFTGFDGYISDGLIMSAGIANSQLYADVDLITIIVNEQVCYIPDEGNGLHRAFELYAGMVIVSECNDKNNYIVHQNSRVIILLNY